MNTIWRFYVDEKHLWRWQQLSVSRTVIAESTGAHKGYDACVADAAGQGYVFVQAKTKALPQKPLPSKSR